MERQLQRAVILALFACAAAGGNAWGIDILVPGMSLQSVSLVPGARVSYLVISEAFGAADSSFIELRVLDHAHGFCRLEIVSSPYPRSREEAVTIRLRLAERATSASSPAEFRSCLQEILIREGRGGFRPPSEKELDDLDIEAIFVRSDDRATRTSLGSAQIATAAGTFQCDGVEVSSTETKSVNLGGVEAQREREEISRAWISRDVPLWGLVQSTVEKRTLTRVPGMKRNVERPRVSKTESTLLSFTMPRRRP
jgi:hypothetical protein